jgi:MFS family permease
VTARTPLAPITGLLRHEPRARRFFVAHAQSSLGTGAACVALLVLAHERFASPWAITVVLLADVIPPMVLGPILGAAADRWPRRSCAVSADIVRAIAFAGIGFVPGFAPMVGFALVAGIGTALFRPAIMAGLPRLVEPDRLPAATSLFGSIEDLGYTLGPALAAAALLISGPATVMVTNAATFAISAALLARVPLGRGTTTTDGDDAPPSLLRSARDGLRATAGMPGVRTLIISTSGVVLFAGLFNVGELLLATDELGVGSAGYAVLVAVFGLGIAAGSIAGANGGNRSHLTRRYLTGLLLSALAFLATGLAPNFPIAILTFAAGGVGNGLVLVHERILIQQLVPDHLLGRVFGLKDALCSWAFAPGFIAGGALATLLGTRALFLLAGVGGLAVWWAAAAALQPRPHARLAEERCEDAHLLPDGSPLPAAGI